MLDLSVVLLTAFALYVTAMRRFGMLNANALFVYIQMIMALGTFAALESTLDVDRIYGYVVLVAMLGYFIGSGTILALYESPAGNDAPPLPRVLRPLPSIWALVALSCVIIILYFQAVGYSALLDGLKNSFSGGDADIAGQRLDSYSGSRYLFPGYVNQFKNALLPALLIVAITYWHRAGITRYLTRGVLVGISLFGLLGTGQRGAFIQILVVVAYYLYLMNGRRLPRRGWLLAPAGLAFIVVSTIALGRSNAAIGQGATTGDRALVALNEFASRVFEVQQASAVSGFRYIYEQPIQWGREWLQGLMGIMPGSAGTDLPNRLYQALYGTDRGTAPPSIWGSVYHNAGWIGVVVVPIVLGVLVAVVTLRSLEPVPRNSLQIVGIAGVSTSIGFWAAGGPETLLNTGLAAYAFLWFWGNRQQARAEYEPASPSPPNLKPVHASTGARSRRV